MRFEVSHIVKAPREKVYAAYTDFEAMPRWSSQRGAVRLSRREGNTVYLESTRTEGGRKAAAQMKLFPPDGVESEGETRFTRTKRVGKFDQVPAGTTGMASQDVRFKGRWGWVLMTRGKAESESSAMEELASFAKYVESLP